MIDHHGAKMEGLFTWRSDFFELLAWSLSGYNFSTLRIVPLAIDLKCRYAYLSGHVLLETSVR
jgi:hypothetical protein